MPCSIISTRASRIGKSQAYWASKSEPSRAIQKVIARLCRKRQAAIATKLIAIHSTILNTPKVALPTSSASGNESDGARNFAGVAIKLRPMSIWDLIIDPYNDLVMLTEVFSTFLLTLKLNTVLFLFLLQ